MTQPDTSISKQLQEAIALAEKVMCKNMTQSLYGDNALMDHLIKNSKGVKQTFWRRANNKLRTAKERISNAWDALRGKLDYDY